MPYLLLLFFEGERRNYTETTELRRDSRLILFVLLSVRTPFMIGRIRSAKCCYPIFSSKWGHFLVWGMSCVYGSNQLLNILVRTVCRTFNPKVIFYAYLNFPDAYTSIFKFLDKLKVGFWSNDFKK